MTLIRTLGQLPPVTHEDYNENFAPYTFVEKLFNEKEIAEIRQLWNNNIEKDGKIDSRKLDKEVRSSSVIFLTPEESGWIYDRLSMAIIMTNANKYKFDLAGFQSRLQLTMYRTGDFYAWHMDMGKGKTSNRKLSITVQLSSGQEYEGGELQFLKGNNTVDAPKDAGTAIIFPAFVAHRVQPVTRGQRMSIVGWVTGPPFR